MEAIVTGGSHPTAGGRGIGRALLVPTTELYRALCTFYEISVQEGRERCFTSHEISVQERDPHEIPVPLGRVAFYVRTFFEF